MGCFPSKARERSAATWKATGTISLRDSRLKVCSSRRVWQWVSSSTCLSVDLISQMLTCLLNACSLATDMTHS
jgi:hypothetical protein